MADEPKPSLQYQAAPSPVTRGQFRLLLLLMLILVVITAQSSYAPGFITWVRQQWVEHRQAMAHRAQVVRTQALAAQCQSYLRPTTKVVWEWDPVRAAKLLAGPGYLAIRPGGPDEQLRTNHNSIENAIPSSAMADEPIRIPVDDSQPPPPPLMELAANATSGPVFNRPPSEAIAFLHQRKASDGSKRLVVVLYHARFYSLNELPLEDRASGGNLNEDQSFTTTSFGPGDDGAFSPASAQLTELSVEPDARLPLHWSPSPNAKQPGTLKVEYRDQLRVYAGQPDAADESHFTIGYDLDGKPGTIDGWLRPNGTVVLEPREGKRVNAQWYPHAK